LEQGFELGAELLVIPSGILGNSIQGETKRSDFLRRTVPDGNHRDLVVTEFPHGHVDGVAVHDDVVHIDDDGSDLSETAEDGFKLSPLLAIVYTRAVW